jgi:hypothetical protein
MSEYQDNASREALADRLIAEIRAAGTEGAAQIVARWRLLDALLDVYYAGRADGIEALSARIAELHKIPQGEGVT